MSADNWRACPRCAAAKKQEAAKIEEKAKKSYGKVHAERFMELLEEAKAHKAKAAMPSRTRSRITRSVRTTRSARTSTACSR